MSIALKPSTPWLICLSLVLVQLLELSIGMPTSSIISSGASYKSMASSTLLQARRASDQHRWRIYNSPWDIQFSLKPASAILPFPSVMETVDEAATEITVQQKANPDNPIAQPWEYKDVVCLDLAPGNSGTSLSWRETVFVLTKIKQVLLHMSYWQDFSLTEFDFSIILFSSQDDTMLAGSVRRCVVAV